MKTWFRHASDAQKRADRLNEITIYTFRIAPRRDPQYGWGWIVRQVEN